MCFSAEASFTTAVVLGTVALFTLRSCRTKPQILLAAIPLLFAIQQLAEGFVWLYLKGMLENAILFNAAKSVFLIFAFLIWPIWIPFSLAVLEQMTFRRIVLFLICACGIALSASNLLAGLGQETSVAVVGHSLQYNGVVPSQTYLYPSIILLPFLISSLKNVWLFGLLIAIGYAIAAYYYDATFTSVWCFFAALVSLSVYKILKDNQPLAKAQ